MRATLNGLHFTIIVGLLLSVSACSVKQGSHKPAATKTTAAKPKADQVLVLKSERKLYVLNDKQVLAKYPIELGRNPMGRKIRQDDGRTPEGNYVIDFHNKESKFTESLHISYPNSNDQAHAHKLGVNPGKNIVIHGLPSNGASPPGGKFDWTEGCIAVSNNAMRHLTQLVSVGTPISIRP